MISFGSDPTGIIKELSTAEAGLESAWNLLDLRSLSEPLLN
jgi:hypothetical protein